MARFKGQSASVPPGRPAVAARTTSPDSNASSTANEHYVTLENLSGDETLDEPDPLSPGLGQEQIADLQLTEGDGHGIAEALERGDDLPIDDTSPAVEPKTPPIVNLKDTIPLLEGEEGESAIPSGFQRSDASKPPAPSPHPDDEEDKSLHRMHKFALYETMTRFYLIGHDLLDRRYRVLKIDRTTVPDQLHVTEDETVYSRDEMNELLNTIEDGNRSVGGIRYRGTSWGLLGFIRFTEGYYMLVISKKIQVATLGGHYVYQIEDTDLIPLTAASTSKINARNPHEARFLNILGNLDLNRNFYFSYSYNLTRTLQENAIKRRRLLAQKNPDAMRYDFNNMFVWNQHLLEPALEALKSPYDWCMPIIHGFMDQSVVDVFGRAIYITLIARRSRFFAGARFLKRGANDLGFVANDVETEQIVADMIVTSPNTPRLKFLRNPNYTSFVQHRGSIPLYWTQDNSGVSPKPAIDLSLMDPFYSTAAMHFDDLFKRYSAPIYVLNLVKARERTPRESKLLVEYQNAIKYLNQSLPEGRKIKYRAYDMSRAAKTPGQDVIRTLEEIADDIVSTVGFFRNDGEPTEDISCVQNGVVRSNCIDCLDRTNAAQFVIGKKALACQLQALGITTDASLNYDSDASNLFAHMFNDQGDTLASQYGGSHLVNTTDSYRKISNWQSHSRDMLESFKRYYHNSFLDSQRQEAYNLFLGNYIYAEGEPMLWELPNDYYLHHAAPSQRAKRHDYINWYTPEYLTPRQLPPSPPLTDDISATVRHDWWDEYYRPLVLSSYHKLFAFHINSTKRYLPKTGSRPSNFDMSPFSVRKTDRDIDPSHSHGHRDTKTDVKKELQSPELGARDIPNPLSASTAPQAAPKRITSLQKWVSGSTAVKDERSDAVATDNAAYAHTRGIPALEAQSSSQISESLIPGDKASKHQWTLAQLHADSLRPSVSLEEATEYTRYLKHPLAMHDPLSVLETNAALNDPESSAAMFANYAAAIAPGNGDVLSGASAGERDPLMSEDRAALNAWLEVEPDPISVVAGDLERKRYAAYGKWVKGKSLFKQQNRPEERNSSA